MFEYTEFMRQNKENLAISGRNLTPFSEPIEVTKQQRAEVAQGKRWQLLDPEPCCG
jgi:hypothetical protein